MKKLNKTDYHKLIEIREKQFIHNGMYIMTCPICGKVVASSSEEDFLPEFTTCTGYGKILTKEEYNELSNEDKIFYKETLNIFSFKK